MTRCTLFLFLFFSGPGSLIADDADTLMLLEELAAQQGKGVIIELEDEKPAGSAEKKKKSRGKQVELIVGGQGEDGIAKRGALIIED